MFLNFDIITGWRKFGFNLQHIGIIFRKLGFLFNCSFSTFMIEVDKLHLSIGFLNINSVATLENYVPTITK